jgi:K(+)-stimulated pyrophosphate-energized sodium pump
VGAVAPDAGEAGTTPGQAVDDATDVVEEPVNR